MAKKIIKTFVYIEFEKQSFNYDFVWNKNWLYETISGEDYNFIVVFDIALNSDNKIVVYDITMSNLVKLTLDNNTIS